MVFMGLGREDGAVQDGQVGRGVVTTLDGDFGALALGGDCVLDGEGAETGEGQFDDGSADGGEVGLGYGHEDSSLVEAQISSFMADCRGSLQSFLPIARQLARTRKGRRPVQSPSRLQKTFV